MPQTSAHLGSHTLNFDIVDLGQTHYSESFTFSIMDENSCYCQVPTCSAAVNPPEYINNSGLKSFVLYTMTASGASQCSTTPAVTLTPTTYGSIFTVRTELVGVNEYEVVLDVL